MICEAHIGFHKTGTTSLQATLGANRDRLGAALLNHPDAALRPLRDACLAYEKRRNAEAGRDVARQMRLALDKTRGDRLVISTEMLCGPIPTPRRRGAVYEAAPDLLAWLREGAAGHDLNLYAYVRDEDRWLTSLYRHLLRSRGVRFTEAELRAMPAFAEFRFDRLLAAIRARAGEVRTWRMEDDVATRLGPGTSFFRALGHDDQALAGWTKVPPQNIGLSRRGVEVMTAPWSMALPRMVRRVMGQVVAGLLPEQERRT
jgi:hypothetical protein